MKLGKWILLLGLGLLFSTQAAFGQHISFLKGKENEEPKPIELKLPYAFYNSNFGAAVGGVYGVTGWPQKQSTFVATVIGGSNSALAGYFLGKDFRIPFTERLFLDPIIALSTFGETENYSSGNPSFRGERAGGNDSSKDNYVEGDTTDNFVYLTFRYLLPIGDGKKEAINTYVMDRGLLHSGATGGKSLWNPFVSGKTFITARPYYRSQKIRADYGDFPKRTNGAEFGLLFQNTDFHPNPSTGNTLRLRYYEDWGWFDSTNPYQVVAGEYSHYFNLGATNTFRQRVLAFDIFTADVPSWNDYDMEGGTRVFHQPPGYQGASLGGLWRMRAYPSYRYNDRSVIYYCGEIRLTPEWNPFAKSAWVEKYLSIPWWQWVFFAEVGRVAPSWALGNLHSEMKFDMGVGVRAQVKGLVLRIDAAGSSESYGVQMFLSQPFQF